MWNERYGDKEYAYGKEPNEFLVSAVGHLPKGRVLSLGEGEGRNAVYMAGLGYDVTAVDASPVGLEKATALAREKNVTIKTVVTDLEHFDFEPVYWDGIVSIWCHLPPKIRKAVHLKIVDALHPGGVLLLEAYTPDQIAYGTGGPPTAEMTMDLDTLQDELPGLEFIHKQELIREVHEGKYHNGTSAVVQVIARKPE